MRFAPCVSSCVPGSAKYVIKHGDLSTISAVGSTSDNEEAIFHVVNVLAECAKETL